MNYLAREENGVPCGEVESRKSRFQTWELASPVKDQKLKNLRREISVQIVCQEREQQISSRPKVFNNLKVY